MKTGLDSFLQTEHKKYRRIKLGVLCNQASLDDKLHHISERVLDPKLKLNIGCFIGPQHGIRGEKQDNMIESADFVDPASNLPVYSLYGDTRVPNSKILHSLDGFLIDLQDIGTRIYTFMYTMANCMVAAKANGKKVIVLDRPNPINGIATEGNRLDEHFKSFVGQYPLIVRHGMTMGELALLFNDAYEIDCDLQIVKLKGWKREASAERWGRDFVPPSPNIPRIESALVFPGMVLFEGTNVSEGRGTTRPFEWIGAPFIDPDKLAKELNGRKIPGVYFRPIFFQPTYQKCKDQICGGVQIHVTNWKKFLPFRAGLHLLFTIAQWYPKEFQWKKPPYEYEFEKMPIDLIAGTDQLRGMIEAGKTPRDFEEFSAVGLAEFRKLRKEYLIY